MTDSAALRAALAPPQKEPDTVRCEVRCRTSAAAMALVNRLKSQNRWYQYEYNRVPVGGAPRFVVRFDGFVSIDHETGETRITVDP